MNGMLEAWLDDYGKIVVDINRQFCNGVSRQFHLIDEDCNVTELQVERIEEQKGVVRYHLVTDYPFVIGSEYQIMIVNARRCPLKYRFIVKSKRFNREFLYEKDDLGARVVAGATEFRLWAPTASEAYLKLRDGFMKMERGERGVFLIRVDEDLNGESYQYLVRVNGEHHLISDPYGKASLPDCRASVVSEREYEKTALSLSSEPSDNIIYEVSVRDFTAEGTFRAFEKKIEYLKKLGISHVQLMPVNDFYSVEEVNRDLYYNWGYDPLQYMVLEGSYSSDARKPEKVNSEFASLVSELHRNNLAVVLDVVFNHHYDAANSSFEHSVPYYFFRYKDEKLSDGTWCGSEFDTQQPMARKFFSDVLEYYVRKYDVDGFRFDLMGFIDIETMNTFAERLAKIKKGIMLYGEGWIMPAGVENSQLAQYDKSDKMPHIGFFNDHFRDTMKGPLYNNMGKGYGSGQLQLVDEAIFAMTSQRFSRRNQSINYVECHDNMTLYDKLRLSCIDDSNEKIREKQRLITAIVVLSQGVPFIHGGQEMYVSHGGQDNTYNGPAEINSLVGKDSDDSLIRYLSALCNIRREYGFNRACGDGIKCLNSRGIILCQIDDCQGKDITIIINPSDEEYTYHFDGERTIVLDKNGLADEKVSKLYVVKPISAAVLSGNRK